MKYYLPSDDAIVNLIISYDLDINPFTTRVITEGINKLITNIESAIDIATLNPEENHEYIHYLIYFRKYININISDKDTPIRLKLEDYYKLKELHKLI